MDKTQTKPYQKTLEISTYVVMGLSLLFFGGWFFDLHFFTQIFTDLPGIKFNTSVLFAVSAVVCHFWIRGQFAPLRAILVSFIFGASVLSLLQDILGISFGMDELVFRDEWGRKQGNMHPGRIPGMTALIFISFALGYFFLSQRSNLKNLGQIFLHLITLLSFIALLGYLLGVPDFYTLSFLTGISPTTVLIWFVYSQVITLHHPRLGLTGLLMGDQVGSKMARRFTPRMILFLLVLVIIRIQLHRFDWVQVEFGITLFALSFLILGLWVIWDAASWLNYSDTKRRNAEEELRQNYSNLEKLVFLRTQELHALLDTAEACIIATDKHGLIRHFSKGAERMLGYEAEEVVDQAKPMLFHDPSEVTERTEKLTQDLGLKVTEKELFTSQAVMGKVYSDEWTYISKSGKRIPVQLSISPIQSPEGKNLGFIGIATDITQLADSRLKLQDLLKKLESKNQQLLNFAHVVSHNLRTPAYSIESLLTIYENEEDEAMRMEYWRLIHEVVKTLLQSMEEALEVLRVQEDQGQHLEKVAFEEVFEKTKLALTGKILESEAEFLADFKELPEVEFSKPYLDSILLNLMSNAIKYRHPIRKPQIQVKTGVEGSRKYLTVSDNGLGIDLKRHGDKVFGMNKVFHAHPEAKGVGLYIVKTQVESLGGKITLTSQPDQGTTFKVEFP